jgi:CspA family cold shock protein
MGAGTVKFFNGQKGYGFIKPEDGSVDVFVHLSGIVHGTPPLAEGMRVMFEVETDRRSGKPRATNVRSAGNDRR